MKKALLSMVLALLLVSFAGAQTINVLFWDDAYPRTLMERIPEFEKATGIKVNFEILQPPQVLTKTSVGVGKDKTDYDLVCVDEGNIPLFAPLMLPYDQWAPGKVYKKVDPKTVTPAMLDVAHNFAVVELDDARVQLVHDLHRVRDQQDRRAKFVDFQQ
jgi:multiple sugar transport system substrate-binding protein